MKIKKLAVLICMLFLLNIGIVFAADMNPILTKFQAVSNNVRTTAEIEIQAYDGGSNPGILLIKLYEDDVEIAEDVVDNSESTVVSISELMDKKSNS